MSFCRALDYVLELSPFVLLVCCYVCATLSFLFDFVSITFLVLFILCELSSVEPLLTSVGDPLMIHFCLCQFYSGNNKSVVRRCFCPSLWTCIDQDLLFLMIQNNVINLIVDPDILLCYQVSSSLRPGCDVLCRVLEAAIWDKFTIFFSQNSTKLVPFWFCLPFDHCPIQVSEPLLPFTLLLKPPVSIVMEDGALSNSLHSLSRFLYSYLISFGHFLARSEVGAYTFMMLMIFFGFILILLILILLFPVGLHSYCGPSAQVSRFSDSWKTQILSYSLQYLWIDSCDYFGTINPLL